MSQSTKRGGLRNPPGGRPPLASDVRKRKISITLDPATVEWLGTQRERENEPLSQVIERLLTTKRGPGRPPRKEREDVNS
jgi:hypothetical protein